MAIILGITKKGIKDVCIVAQSLQEGEELTALYQDIEPEVNAFQDIINAKLQPFGENLNA